MLPPIINIAAYKFVELEKLVELRKQISEICRTAELRGTILISVEGINIFVAGSRPGIDLLVNHLRTIPTLFDLPIKESFSDEQPFNRMLVKIKQEIIAFGVPEIDPRKYTSRRLSAKELKRWLDDGEPITLLDTRNNFEVKTGTFTNAVAIDVDDFRDFPSAVKQLPEAMKKQRVVTFCTGGIRCEKAAPLLEREGFTDVYQLDGGILKYLEECGGAHYEGQCFVFDKRVAVNTALKEGGLRQCFVCQAILSPAEQSSPNYLEGKWCPACFKTPVETMQQVLARRRAEWLRVSSQLPGSVPFDNERPISVPLRFDGYELLDYLDSMKTHLSREEWKAICEEGRFVCRGQTARPGRIVRSGERYFHKMPATLEPAVNVNLEFIYEDESIVVVDKPAPLPMHPCGRFNRNSLSYLLDQVYLPLRLRSAHRLDADTTGVVVFGKTGRIANRLHQQFATRTVAKIYLARVHGNPIADEFECHEPIAADSDESGVRLPDANGSVASTRFRKLKRFADGTTLLSVQPLTGRTNQIRAHLWHLQFPIVGDPIYLTNGALGVPKSLSVNDSPLCLHANAIEFEHPTTQLKVRYEAKMPLWAMAD